MNMEPVSHCKTRGFVQTILSGRSCYLHSSSHCIKCKDEDICTQNTPAGFRLPIWLCTEISTHMWLAFADCCHRQAVWVHVSVIKHFKQQDYVQICSDLIPKHETCFKTALEESLRLNWKVEIWIWKLHPLKIMCVDCPSWPVLFSADHCRLSMMLKTRRHSQNRVINVL